MQEESIIQKMWNYNEVKDRNRPDNTTNPGPHGSPGSFASQNPYSPRKVAEVTDEDAGEDEDIISQEEFCTQAPPPVLISPTRPARSLNPYKPATAPIVARSKLLQSFLADKRPDSAGTTSHSILPQHRNTESVPTPSERPTDVPSLPSNPTPQTIAVQTESDPVIPLSVNTSAVETPHTSLENDADNSSPIEVTELEAHDQPFDPRSAGSKDEPVPKSLPEMGPKDLVAPVQIPEAPVGPFLRWRQQQTGGRYIPRYASKIPRDQERFLGPLLQTGDSWQPALVGRASRPGGVPLNLLQRFCDAADQQAGMPAESVLPTDPLPVEGQVPQKLPTGQSDNPTGAPSHDEDTEDGEVEWSQSQPTQQRRQLKILSIDSDSEDGNASEESADLSSSPPVPHRQMPRLPQSSPPVSPLRQRQHFDTRSELGAQSFVAVKSPGKPRSSVKPGVLHKVDSHPESLGNRSPSNKSEVHVQSTPAVAETPQSFRSSVMGQNDHGLRITMLPLASSQADRDTSARKVQVKRTPYPGKASNLMQRMQEEQADNGPTSSFVPATYASPTSHVMATVAGNIRAKASPVINKSASRGARSGSIDTCDHIQVETSKTKLQAGTPRSTELGTANVVDSKADADQISTQAHVEGVALSGGEVQGPGVQLHVSRQEPPKVDGDVAQVESTAHGKIEPRILEQPKSTDTPMQDVNAVSADSSRNLAAPVMTKRKRELSETNDDHHKRPRHSPQRTAVDPDYGSIDERRFAYRREQMRAIGKPKADVRQSTSSSMVDIASSSGFPEAPVDLARQSHLPRNTIDASKQSSTPLTRQSTYSGVWNAGEKVQLGDPASMSSAAVVTPESDEDLFARYKAAYLDYEGSMNDFRKSYYFVQGVLNGEPNKIHSSLLDDAIFHHYHTYRSYKEVVDFVKYFNDCVDDPTHHKRIIKLGAPAMLPSRTDSRLSAASPSLTRQVPPTSETPSVPAGSADHISPAKDELEEKRRQFLERTTLQAPMRTTLSQESIQSIEKWRENAAQRGSPELGSPDIDRSLLQTVVRQYSVSARETPDFALSARRQARLSANSLPVPAPEPPQSRIRERTSASVVQAAQKIGPAASPTVEPSRVEPTIKVEETRTRASVVPTASYQSPARAQRPRKSMVGTGMAFTDFDKKYAQLQVRKREEAAIAKAGSATAGGDARARLPGMAINIFSWRK